MEAVEVKLELKDAADWVYRGEGAANLVLAYRGSSPAFIGKVIRCQKVVRKGLPTRLESKMALTEHERLLWREDRDLVSAPTKEIAGQLYVQLVMSPLLGSQHVDPGRRVHVSREFLECVEKNVIKNRPSWRVDAARLDIQRDSAIILSDHSLFHRGKLEGGPCISVEIKPKYGCLPSSSFISEENSMKRSVSRFRMHQFLKLNKQEISELSKYDPLDLFSGSRERIRKAIKNLYSTPQNNFRVFLDGVLIFGGIGGGTSKTNGVTGKEFEDMLQGVIQADDGLRTASFLQLVAETVYSSRVLDRLLEVQKLDYFDVEGAIHLYYNIISQPCAVCRKLNEARLPHKYSSLHSFPIDKSLKIVKDFLISATAKDCSVMIGFRPRKDGDVESSCSSVSLQCTKQDFYYKVNFIDLDLKPLKKMVDYYELDKEILNCYNRILNTMREKGNNLGREAYETANGDSSGLC